MRNATGRPRALGLRECYCRRSLAYGLLTAAAKILKAKSWAPGEVCALLRMENNKNSMVWFPCIYFVHRTAPGRSRRSRGERKCEARLIASAWASVTGCSLGQGMVFNLSVLNRVSNLVRVCPNYKQGIARLHIKVRASSQIKGLERGWKQGARLERDAKKPFTRACEILKLRYADFEKKSQLFCSC